MLTKYSVFNARLLEFDPKDGPSFTTVYKEVDLLPVLRAAESLAQMTTSFSADEYPVMVKEALALLDSIKQIDATKGVEG